MRDTSPVDTLKLEPGVDREERFHSQARRRFERARQFWEPVYDLLREDVAFLSGEQWEDDATRARKGRPQLTFNQLPKYVRQVVGGVRSNPPAITTHPVDGMEVKAPNVAGKQDYALHEIYDGIIRNIESVSNARDHYARALQHCVAGSVGWLRVATDFVDNHSFEQDILIRSIYSPTSVYMDPDAREVDFSDAEYAFVLETISEQEYKARYGESEIPDYTLTGDDTYRWYDTENGNVTIVEYFYRAPVTKKIYRLADGSVIDDEAVIDDLAAKGMEPLEVREIKSWQVRWRLINGYRTLEKERDWLTPTIPLVPVTGPELLVGGRKTFESLIRHAKDAQRSYNYQMSQAIEMVALQPKAPFVGQAEAFEGYESLYERANVDNLAYLPYNKNQDGAPQRQPMAQMPAAELQTALAANDNIKSTIGVFDASLGARSNETSGRAIMARQREGDEATQEFPDALGRAMRRLGKVLVDLIPRVYDADKTQRIRTLTGGDDTVQINHAVVDGETGEKHLIHDLSYGKYDVEVSMGPSFSTQQQQASEMLTQVMQAAPNLTPVIMPIFAKMQDWPYAEEFARVMRNTAPPQALTPAQLQERQQEMESMPKPPPSPEEQLEAQKVEMELQKEQAQLEAVKARAGADVAKAQAEIASLQAQPGQMENIADQRFRANMGDLAPVIEEAVKEEVATAFAEVIQANQQRRTTNEQ